VSGSILSRAGDTAALEFGPLNITGILNNKDFIGKLPTIQGVYNNAADTASFNVTVGDITYSTTSADITQAAAQTLTFTGKNSLGAAAGGSFTLTLAGGAVTAFGGQATLDPITARINDALSNITIYQYRLLTLPACLRTSVPATSLTLTSLASPLRRQPLVPPMLRLR
jgi:hypothetical protein